MTDFTASQPGQANLSGSDLALLKTEMSNEVITEFHDNLLLDDSKLTVRELSGAKSTKFPAIGGTTAYEHVKGQEVDPSQLEHAEVEVTLDRPVVSPVFLDEADEIMLHYNLRAPYMEEMATALRERWEDTAFRTMIKAARTSARVSGGNGGASLYDTNYATDSVALLDGIWDGITNFQQKNVRDQVYAYMSHTDYNMLVRDQELLNKDRGGVIVYTEGKILKVGGVIIEASNRIPSVDDTANTNLNAKYRIDSSNVRFLMSTKKAVGVAKAKGLTVDVVTKKESLGTLLIAKMFYGMDAVRGECALEGVASVAP